MPVTYIINQSSSNSGPWTPVPGSPFNGLTDTITGLAPGSGPYFFQFIAQDILLGIQSVPVVVGPFNTSAQVTESLEGTTITTVGPIINASNTPGTAQASPPYTTFALTGVPGQILRNGVVDSITRNVTELYYHNHTTYQFVPANNNQWYVDTGTVNGWVASASPLPQLSLSISQVNEQVINQPFTVQGTMTGYSTPPLLQYADATAGNVSPTFDDEFTTLNLQYQGWSAGQKWMLITTFSSPGQGEGGPALGDFGRQWWVNPFNPNTPFAPQTPNAANGGLYTYNGTTGGLTLALQNMPASMQSYVNSVSGVTNLNYAGCILQTQNSMLTQYGYYELQLAVDKVPGFDFQFDIEAYPTGPNPPEIDFGIMTNSDGNQYIRFVIAGTTSVYQNDTGSLGIDATVPNIYGINWQSTGISLYINGVLIASYPTPAPLYTSYPMFAYLLTGANYRSDVAPAPASLPAYAHVGYFRRYNTMPTVGAQTAFQNLPSGANVTTSTFTFTHPAVTTPTPQFEVTVRAGGTGSSIQTLLGAYISFPGSTTYSNDLSTFTTAMGQAPVLQDVFIDLNQGWGSPIQGNAAFFAALYKGLAFTPVFAIPMAVAADTSANAAFLDIINGVHDADFNSFFASFVSNGFANCYIRPGWEMNIPGWPWSIDGTTVGNYVLAFQHIATLAHSYPNSSFKVIWCPNANAPIYGGINAFYPGDGYVDIISIDQFGPNLGGPPLSQMTEIDGVNWSMEYAATMAVAHNKPFAIDEACEDAAGSPAFTSAMVTVLETVAGLRIDHLTIVNDPSQALWATNPTAAAAWKAFYTQLTAFSANSTSVQDISNNFIIANTPPGAPGPITSLTSPSATTNSAVLEFAPPLTGGAIDNGGVRIQYQPTGSLTGSWQNGPFIPIITPNKGNFQDQSGNVWAVTSGGQITVNGTIDTITSGVIELLIMPDGTIWQLTNVGTWYSKTDPSQNWAGPVTTSPLSTIGVVLPLLEASTSYLCSGYAVNSSGQGVLPFPITVTAAASTGPPADTITGFGASLTTLVNTAFNGTVATFTDSNTSVTASQLTATINWGDNTANTSGTVTGSNGAFSVSGTHTYTSQGNFTVTTVLTETIANPGTGSITSPMSVTSTVGVPGIVTNLAAPVVSSTTVTLTFGLPTTGGPITNGAINTQYRKGTSGAWTTGPAIPLVTPGQGSFTDGSGNVWAVTSGGQITVNGVIDTITNGVTQLCLFPNGAIWQNAPSGWYTESAPNSSWQGPQTDSPFTNPGATIVSLSTGTQYQFTVYCSNGTLVGAQAPPVTVTTSNVNVTGQFTASNGRILDPNGNLFVSKGMAIFDSQINSITPAQLKNFFPRLNLIRLSIGGAVHGFNTPAVSFSTLTNWVNAAISAGLVVVFDDHEQNSGTPVYTGTTLTNDLNYATQVANAFKNQTYVWLQSMNEPGSSGQSLANYHLQFYNAVRNTGASNIVIHDGYGGNLPNPPSDQTGPYNGMWNAGWDAHFYNWMTSGNTNQSQVNSYLNTHVQVWQNFAKFATSATSTNNNTPFVWMGEVGFIDYNGNMNVEANGGDGTNQVVIAPFQTNTSNGGLCSGEATWLVNGGTIFGPTVSDLLNNSFSAITQHGVVWNNNT